MGTIPRSSNRCGQRDVDLHQYPDSVRIHPNIFGRKRHRHLLDGSRRVLKHGVQYTQGGLAEAEVYSPPVDGAFYIFPDFGAHRERLKARGIETSERLSQVILEDTGVAFLPGSAFGRPSHELTARMSLVDFDGESALMLAQEEHGDALDSALRDTCCGRMVEATTRLVEWIHRGE
jgi:aspartate aminotransferase